MLLALFSDIHGNREGFDACLADARKRGAERFVFLGDLVGYGADPAYVIDRVAQLEAEGALVVKGNHDAAISAPFVSMNQYARAAIEWTRNELNEAQKAFLADLPLTAELGEMLFVHSEAYDPEGWIYVTRAFEAHRSMCATGKRITVSGHVHSPHLYHMTSEKTASGIVPSSGVAMQLAESAKWHAILGSVGQPRDSIPAAAYGLYDDRSRLFTFQRVSYDIERAAHKIKAAGLPALLSARLFIGR